MNRYIPLLAIFVLFQHVTLAQKKQGLSIVVKGPATPLIRLPETLSIPWKDILKKYPGIKPDNLKVLSTDNAELPYQLEYKGLSAIQNLLIPVHIAGGKSLALNIVEGKPAATSSKVFGRYVPERKDDFAWENDKIAFRMYGKALESTNENAYGIDVWAKRTDKMILDKWYKSGDYHADHGDGLDYYSVGFTLGAGDIAPYINSKIVFPKNYRKSRILDNGPIRFSFELEYEEWDVDGKPVKVVKQFSLDAGSQLNRVAATFTFNERNTSLPVVVGIVKRKEKGTISSFNNNDGVLGYWEPEHATDGILGIGTIMMDTKSKAFETDSHLLQETNASSGKAVVYYNGAAWNKAGDIKNAEEWFQYLHSFKQTLNSPLSVKIN
jgi:hypothetical protein